MAERKTNLNPITEQLIQLELQAEHKLNEHTTPAHFSNPTNLTSNQRIRLFSAASTAWKDIYNPQSLQAVLKPGDICDSETAVKTIKDQRGFAQLLRSAYHMFHTSNQAPEPLETLIKTLGICADERVHNSDASSVDRAIAAIHAYDPDQVHTFSPIADGVFFNHAQSQLVKIKEFASHTTHTVDSFHKLRKKIREFMDIYRLMASLNMDHHAADSYFFLYRLNHLLGHDRDKIVAKSMNHKQSDQIEEINLSDEEKRLINHFLHAFL